MLDHEYSNFDPLWSVWAGWRGAGLKKKMKKKKICLKSDVLQRCVNMPWWGTDFIFSGSINCWANLLLCDIKTKLRLTRPFRRSNSKKSPTWLREEGQNAAVHGAPGVPARQSVNTLPLNHGATYWSTQMKSVSFFPDHKLIKNPLCWHQTVWHKLKLIHNWVCIDFYPAFAGYIRAWLVSFCSRVYSKCKPRSGLAVHSRWLAQIKHKKKEKKKRRRKKRGSEGQFLHLYPREGWMKNAFRVTLSLLGEKLLSVWPISFS